MKEIAVVDLRGCRSEGVPDLHKRLAKFSAMHHFEGTS